MFEFINVLRGREKAKIDGVEEYRRLLRKGADAGQLSTADQTKLVALADNLGKNSESVEADVAVFAEEKRLSIEAKDVEAIRAASKASRKAVVEYDMATAEIIRQRQQQRKALEKQSGTDMAKLTATLAAADQLAKLRDAHYSLLSLPDPSIRKRQRYLSHFCLPLPGAAGTEVILFELVLLQPQSFDLSFYDFKPAPNQTPEEFARLKGLAFAATSGALGPVCYLLERKRNGYPRLDATVNQIVRYIEDIESGASDPTVFTVLPHPGQSQAECDNLTARWRDAWAKKCGRDTHENRPRANAFAV